MENIKIPEDGTFELFILDHLPKYNIDHNIFDKIIHIDEFYEILKLYNSKIDFSSWGQKEFINKSLYEDDNKNLAKGKYCSNNIRDQIISFIGLSTIINMVKNSNNKFYYYQEDYKENNMIVCNNIILSENLLKETINEISQDTINKHIEILSIKEYGIVKVGNLLSIVIKFLDKENTLHQINFKYFHKIEYMFSADEKYLGLRILF